MSRSARPAVPRQIPGIAPTGAQTGRQPRPVPAVLATAFRPFFLLAALAAALPVFAWIGLLGRQWDAPAGLDTLYWHGHGQVFGFASALIAGFLLTAVGNWTGRRATGPRALLALIMLWLCARLGLTLPGLVPHPVAAMADLLFLLVLAALVARPIVATRNLRNLGVIGWLLAFAALNAAAHAAHGGLLAVAPQAALSAAVYLLAALLAFMGGRVIPFFTERRLGLTVIRRRALDLAGNAAAVGLAAAVLLLPHTAFTTAIAAAAAALTLARMAGWRSLHTWREPMLWVLHLGYLWLAAGFALTAWVHAGAALPAMLPVHALSVGALGLLGLGMMARVALGHSGREIRADAAIVAMFLLVAAAGALRMAAYAPGPLQGLRGLTLSGIGWTLAFGLYLVRYAPILLRPRPDGREG
jgi:uncharacterized protein involved in response to NO